MPRTRSLAWSELKIGVLTIMAIVIGAVLVFSLTGTKGFSWQRYNLKTRFTNVAGLASGSPVRIAGVEVGTVTGVQLVGEQVEVVFQVNEKDKPLITDRSVARLGSVSLLGQSAVDITPAASGTPIEPWGYVPQGPPVAVLSDMTESASQGLTELTAMIHELAEFERASADCTVTESQLRDALFGDHPTVYGHIAEVDGQAAAGALWFRNFSTWDGVAGIYLEDLFVRPQFRRRGLARKVLATLAKVCVGSGYTRLSWAVLDWNVNAIALYDAVGGRPQTEWITYRVSGPELSALAGES